MTIINRNVTHVWPVDTFLIVSSQNNRGSRSRIVVAINLDFVFIY